VRGTARAYRGKPFLDRHLFVLLNEICTIAVNAPGMEIHHGLASIAPQQAASCCIVASRAAGCGQTGLRRFRSFARRGERLW
jgi:hypothetical protein